jgi:Asp-tRNA(Asn)/Glu-tRNA(Gln) amidotransferase A subunit family amidase
MFGRSVSEEALRKGRASRLAVRTSLERTMDMHEIDLWISPAATGTAPEGIASTGDPAMNLPWTHAGVPTITIPSGKDKNGLPYGLQITARFMKDETLLSWARGVEDVSAAAFD